MEFTQLVETRVSVRQFKPGAVPPSRAHDRRPVDEILTLVD
jgi:hypothetical protein